MKKNSFFSAIKIINWLVLIIGLPNLLLWSFWFFAFVLALGTDGPKGDFGRDWLNWVLANQVIASIWSSFGVFFLIRFLTVIDKPAKKEKMA